MYPPARPEGGQARALQAARQAGEGCWRGRPGGARAPSCGSSSPAAAEGTSPDDSRCEVSVNTPSQPTVIAKPSHRPAVASPAARPRPPSPPQQDYSSHRTFRRRNIRPPRRPRDAAYCHWSDLKRSRGRAGCAVPVALHRWPLPSEVSGAACSRRGSAVVPVRRALSGKAGSCGAFA